MLKKNGNCPKITFTFVYLETSSDGDIVQQKTVCAKTAVHVTLRRFLGAALSATC